MSSQRLYVGNLPYSVTVDDLRELFSEYGEINDVHLVTDRDTGRPRGFGFVEMEGADQAIDGLNGKEFEGRTLTVNIARPRGGR